MFFSVKSYGQQSIDEHWNVEKKYTLLEEASELRNKENYDQALAKLDYILLQHPDDQDVWMLKSDVLLQKKDFGEASKTLEKLDKMNFKNTQVKINWSYALFMSHRPKKALYMAQKAFEQAPKEKSALINFINAQLWNADTDQATKLLHQHRSLLETSDIEILEARIASTSGDFQKASGLYAALAQSTDNPHYVKEAIELLQSKGYFEESQRIIEAQTELLSPNHKASLVAQKRSQNQHKVGIKQDFFQDIGENQQLKTRIFVQQGGTKRLRLGMALASEKYSEPISTLKAQRIQLLGNWKINAVLRSESQLEGLQLKGINTEDDIHIVGLQTLVYQPNDRQMLAWSYEYSLLNFTSSILENQIGVHTLGLKNHSMWSAQWGVYSQASYAFFSDQNQQAKIFASVYHLFRNHPTLKLGWNNSYLHYSQQEGFSYFSPHVFLSSELFAELGWKNPNWKHFFLNAQAAYGLQRIEKQNWESAYRFDIEIGWELKHFDLSTRYQTSNIASANGTGYQYDGLSFQLAYKWNARN